MSNPYLRYKPILHKVVQDMREIIRDASIVGLGTGRTISILIDVLHETNMLSGRKLVTTSIDTTLKLYRLGYLVTDLLSVNSIDIYIDSADKVDKAGNMIKGGGAALTMEKILTVNSSMKVFIVDESKVVDSICPNHAIPLDIVPNSLALVTHYLKRMGFKVEVRSCNCKRGPAVSDVGGVIIDVVPPTELCSDLRYLEQLLDSIPGVITSGLFYKPANKIYVINESGFKVY